VFRSTIESKENEKKTLLQENLSASHYMTQHSIIEHYLAGEQNIEEILREQLWCSSASLSILDLIGRSSCKDERINTLQKIFKKMNTETERE
jgi:hypothetical protein